MVSAGHARRQHGESRGHETWHSVTASGLRRAPSSLLLLALLPVEHRDRIGGDLIKMGNRQSESQLTRALEGAAFAASIPRLRRAWRQSCRGMTWTAVRRRFASLLRDS